ncbi:MAG: hypothetical protein JKY87_03965 [Mariprofundus sp.]|nr:hypothetical protein [Mariprofundus sp.]
MKRFWHCWLIGLAAILSLSACAWVTPILQSPTDKLTPISIGPYPVFSGRLLVTEPRRRWQVEIDWQAQQAETGTLRLSHALSGTVVDFRWQDSWMQIRDNQFPHWRNIQQQELAQHGLVIPPSQLASILLGHIPAHFIQKKHDTLESRASGSLIRLRWQSSAQKLTITDLKHGRTAKLIISETK